MRGVGEPLVYWRFKSATVMIESIVLFILNFRLGQLKFDHTNLLWRVYWRAGSNTTLNFRLPYVIVRVLRFQCMASTAHPWGLARSHINAVQTTLMSPRLFWYLLLPAPLSSSTHVTFTSPLLPFPPAEAWGISIESGIFFLINRHLLAIFVMDFLKRLT